MYKCFQLSSKFLNIKNPAEPDIIPASRIPQLGLTMYNVGPKNKDKKKTKVSFLFDILLIVIIKKYIGLKKTIPTKSFSFKKFAQTYPKTVKKRKNSTT